MIPYPGLLDPRNLFQFVHLKQWDILTIGAMPNIRFKNNNISCFAHVRLGQVLFMYPGIIDVHARQMVLEIPGP
jgi:hypothetical protein